MRIASSLLPCLNTQSFSATCLLIQDSTVYYNDEDWLNGMDIYRDKTEFWSMWKDMGDYMNKKTAHYKH